MRDDENGKHMKEIKVDADMELDVDQGAREERLRDRATQIRQFQCRKYAIEMQRERNTGDCR